MDDVKQHLEMLFHVISVRIRDKRWQAGVRACTEFLELAEKSAKKGAPIPDFRKSRVYQHRALAHSEIGMYDSALADFRAAIKLTPDNAEIYSDRGKIHSEYDEFDRAFSDFDEALKLDPEFAIAYNNRGMAHEKKGDFDLALADFNQALELDPHLAPAYHNRGNVYRIKGKIDRAIEDHNDAFKIRSGRGDSDDHNLRGLAYAAKGDYDRAIADYNEAIKKDSENADALRNRDDVIVAKVEKQYQEQFKKQQEQFGAVVDDFRTEFLERHEYKKRQDDYQTEADDTEKRIKRQFAWLYAGVVAALAFSLYVAHMLLFQQEKEIWPGILPIFPLITVLGLCISPLIWKIRILKQEKARLLALSQDAYTKGILANLFNVNLGAENRKELLHKFFDHHAEHGSAQLIIDLENNGKSESGAVNVLIKYLKDNMSGKN